MKLTEPYQVGLFFIIGWSIMILLSYLMKKAMIQAAEKAIREQRLSTGIYRFYPVTGEHAVRLAKGYINAARLQFWFGIFFIPFVFVLSIISGTLRI